MKPKNPAVAVALSFAIPGAGHLYLGCRAKGAAYLAAALSMAGYVLVASMKAAAAVADGGDLELAMAQAPGIGLVAGLAFPALMAITMADAWFTAKKLN